jgi:hypothetical protein
MVFFTRIRQATRFEAIGSPWSSGCLHLRVSPTKLKKTLSEIRSCLSTGKRLSVEREDETMTEYFNSQQQAFDDNELMNLFKTYGL